MHTKKITAEVVRSIVESRIEADPLPVKIRDYLATVDGKALGKRDETKMRATIDDSIRVVYEYTMLKVEWVGYGVGKGQNGGSLVVAHDSKVVDFARFTERNAAYFSAREERNALRQKALEQPKLFERLADAMNAKLAAEAEIRGLFEYGKPLSPDQYTIEKLMGGES